MTLSHSSSALPAKTLWLTPSPPELLPEFFYLTRNTSPGKHQINYTSVKTITSQTTNSVTSSLLFTGVIRTDPAGCCCSLQGGDINHISFSSIHHALILHVGVTGKDVPYWRYRMAGTETVIIIGYRWLTHGFYFPWYCWHFYLLYVNVTWRVFLCKPGSL